MEKSRNTVLIIDAKMISVEIELSQGTLRMLGISEEDIRKHKSRRQLLLEVSDYLKSFEK